MSGKSGLKRNLAYARTGKLCGLPERLESEEVDIENFRIEQ